jgi:quercetin dioxygenase-like cupin family protein
MAYPYTIENGAGERLTFLRVVRDGETERVEAEGFATPGAGPPMHVHRLQEEAIEVVSGKLGYQVVGGAPQYAGPGERVAFAPGVGHKWWNAGSDELHTTGWAKPPFNIEFFLGAIFDATRRGGGTRPGIFDAVYLTTRYRSEFELLEIPGPVKRILFPIVYALGYVLGKHARYKDAPPPIAGPRA